jgi:hypothetical protein
MSMPRSRSGPFNRTKYGNKKRFVGCEFVIVDDGVQAGRPWSASDATEGNPGSFQDCLTNASPAEPLRIDRWMAARCSDQGPLSVPTRAI